MKDTDYHLEKLRWGGPSLDILQALAQSFCRCRNRLIRFGGKVEAILSNGPEGMCGMLVSEMITFLTRMNLTPPTQKYIATSILRVNAATFGKFLNGMPSGKHDWITNAKSVIKFLLRGQDSVITSDEDAIANRIEEYFFRGFDPERKQPPSYFQPQRQQSGAPCSRKELSGEIEWVAFEKIYFGEEIKLIWVSGESHFFPEGHDKSVAQAVMDVVRTEGKITFITRSSTSAYNDLCEFAEQYELDTNPHFLKMDLAKESGIPSERKWDFLNPSLQFLFLHTSGNSEDTLFILRGSEPDDDRRIEYGPIALQANKGELEAFKKWLALIDND